MIPYFREFPPAIWYGLRRWADRHRLLASALAALVAYAILLTVFVLLWRAARVQGG